MGKIPTRYYKVDPWLIEEDGFLNTRSEVSESIFALSNEYVGLRGFFEESYKAPKLIGTYYNGIYEVPLEKSNPQYKGISNKSHFMVNAPNFLKMVIMINDKEIDLSQNKFTGFKRILDLKSGLLTRSFIYLDKTTRVQFTFKRILDMKQFHNAYQVLEIEAMNEDINISVKTLIDYNVFQWGNQYYWNLDKYEFDGNNLYAIGSTKQTHQLLASKYELIISHQKDITKIESKDEIGHEIKCTLEKGKKFSLEKRILNVNDRTLYSNVNEELIDKKLKEIKEYPKLRSFNLALESNKIFYENVWKKYDIEIEGDILNQQGIRYCIFQLVQTYQGLGLNHNIGAKGLTGEAYSGNAFWDTETYCLPFYILNDPKSAKDLLMFRYMTLDKAKERALELDCKGACYPIATCNGDEACALWQHASLQFQPTSAVSYAIEHYVKNTNDYDFLFDYGIEMVIECARCLSSRGDWNSSHTNFGLYCVMGPDEFQMMVNHNTYTNYMAKKTLEYALTSLEKLKQVDYDKYQKLVNKMNITSEELNEFQDEIDHMVILYNEETKIYEQHQGYFDLPHVNVNEIPVTDFPLYSHWSYDRIYRNDMIKQPDVLMFMFLYPQDFSYEVIKANYEFYEPRTIHESSLSPSIHSVFAMELGKFAEAVNFFAFATRMDLDDYNRNTKEGLHTTSIAAAWVNIVYGFGGLRSDKPMLSLNPKIPGIWKSYTFHFRKENCDVTVKVNKNELIITTTNLITLKVYGNIITINDKVVLKTKNE